MAASLAVSVIASDCITRRLSTDAFEHIYRHISEELPPRISLKQRLTDRSDRNTEKVHKGMTTMFNFAGKIASQCARASIVAMSALALMILSTASARAQNSFTLSISAKEQKLANPTDMMWDKWLMWDLGYERMMDRNAPYLQLQNDASSTSPITEFHITIGDNRFNFGPVENSDLVMLGSTTPGFSLSASTLNSAGDELVVTIGNGGLLPGQEVRFRIKLDVDPSFAAQYAASFGASQPDYRTVMFDMNGVNVYDGVTHSSNADNSQAYAVFTPGGKSSTEVFEDEPVAAGQYYNNNLRPYLVSDAVLIFQLNGSEVPEPTTIGLAMLGVFGVLFCRRCRRSSAAG